MRLLPEIAGVQIIETTGGRVVYISWARIDADGSGGNPHKDPYFQADTSYHHMDKALNAYTVPFVVLPPAVIKAVKGIVLGCQCFLTNLKTGKVVEAVCGDVGPMKKIGELSVAAAVELGLDGNPNHGGTDEKVIGYEILPGVPAMVHGIQYDLQRYGA